VSFRRPNKQEPQRKPTQMKRRKLSSTSSLFDNYLHRLISYELTKTPVCSPSLTCQLTNEHPEEQREHRGETNERKQNTISADRESFTGDNEVRAEVDPKSKTVPPGLPPAYTVRPSVIIENIQFTVDIV